MLENKRTYGTTGHPGSVDFEEEALHGTSDELTVLEETKELLRLLPRIKLIFLCIVPLVVLLVLGGPLATAAPLVAVSVAGLALVLTVPCQITLIECLEDLVVRHSSDTLGVIVNVLFENASLTLFSLFSVISGTRHALCFVKSTVLGCVLFQVLVVLGASVFMSDGNDRGEGALSMQTWSTFGSGLLLSTTVFLVPTLYDLTVATPNTITRLQRNQTTFEAALKEETDHSLLLSRGLCVVMLAAYVIYVLHMLRTHYNYFSSAGNPNSPSTLSYVLLYREQAVLVATAAVAGYGAGGGGGASNSLSPETDGVFVQSGGRSYSSGRDGQVGGPRFSRRFAIWSSVLLFVLLAAVCECLVLSLPSALRAMSWLSQPFLVVIVLPFVFSLSSLGAGMLLAQMGRLDISVSIAFSSIVHIFCCISPFVVIVAWCLGRPLELVFHAFLAVMCFVSVLVTTQLVMWNRATQLEGSTLITIYLLLAVVCALGGWHMCTV